VKSAAILAAAAGLAGALTGSLLLAGEPGLSAPAPPAGPAPRRSTIMG
jgi:hypothetical protein